MIPSLLPLVKDSQIAVWNPINAGFELRNGLTNLDLNLQCNTVVVQISTVHNQRSMIKVYLFV